MQDLLTHLWMIVLHRATMMAPASSPKQGKCMTETDMYGRTWQVYFVQDGKNCLFALLEECVIYLGQFWCMLVVPMK